MDIEKNNLLCFSILSSSQALLFENGANGSSQQPYYTCDTELGEKKLNKNVNGRITNFHRTQIVCTGYLQQYLNLFSYKMASVIFSYFLFN